MARADSTAKPPSQAASAWAIEPEQILHDLDSDASAGLTGAQARQRLERYGPNRLTTVRSRSALGILARQFKSLVVGLLVVACVLAFILGDIAEGLAIAAVLVVNAGIGFFVELRATRSMEALRALGSVETRVIRDGQQKMLDAEQLVPGDLVVLEAGDMITADLRIIEAAKLAADESALTGESVPVAKHPQALPEETALMDRDNQLFKGTILTRGSGKAVVTATGGQTQLGHISASVASAESQASPLEQRLNKLGRKLVWACLGIAIVIAVTGVLAGREWELAIQVAIALAIAAIPEGLPIVATLALTRGMWRMARRNALVVRLSAVETLGATGVILTDKTGTLTENRMTVTQVVLPEAAAIEVSGTGLSTEGEFRMGGARLPDEVAAQLDALLTTAALCNNAELGTDRESPAAGDPTEVALLVAAAKRGLLRPDLLARSSETREEPFDPQTKAMATFNRLDGCWQIHVKGAPEAVLAMCSQVRVGDREQALDEQHRSELEQAAAQLAEAGLRTLALATRRAESDRQEPFRDLLLLGLVGLLDPPRKGVDKAIAACQDAGIRVVMVTGDHAATAQRVAIATGVLGERNAGQVFDASGWPSDHADITEQELQAARIFARATPGQKLALIGRYQDLDQVVAMTGDGVNDAPALKKADIGVAMGLRGTQVAKDAAAMVLQDDEFGTIREAIAQGRAIYANLRKFVLYLLSCNTSEILIIGVATAAGAPLPLLPLQILFLNLVTDVFPALALGVGEGHPDLMKKPPRPASEQLVEARHWQRIVAYGALLAASVLAAMAVAIMYLELSNAEAVTVSFLTLALAQLWHVFNMRERDAGLWRNEITRNRWMWLALLLCLLLLALALLVEPLPTLLQLRPLPPAAWGLVLAASVVPVLLGPLVRRIGAA